MALSPDPVEAIHVIEITQVAAIGPLAARWDRVVSGSATPNVFMTSDWLAAWWEHFGKGRDLWMLLIEGPSGEPVGAAPLMVVPYRAGGIRLRALEFLGADVPACADHLEVTSTPGWEATVTHAIGQHILGASVRWDVARWAGVPDGSPSMSRVVSILEARGCRTTRTPSLPCPFLPLEPPWEAYDQHLHRKFRDLKKYLAAIERHNGRFLVVRTDAELHRVLADLRRLSLRRVRSKGETSGLERDDLFAVVTRVCDRFLRKGWLRLYALEVDGAIIAVNLNFAYGQKVYGYLSGLDPAWSRHGVGTVLMRHVVRSSMEEGFEEYDFLRGGEDYKYRWTSRQRTATTVQSINRPLRYWAFAGGRFAARACSIVRERVWSRNGSSGTPDPSPSQSAPETGAARR